MVIDKDRSFDRFINGIVAAKWIGLLMLFIPIGLYGQSQNLPNLVDCDESVARQDAVVSVALERLRDYSFLIIVIRPGVGENSSQLASKRLFNMRQYFKLRGSRLKSDRLIFANGVPTEGLGQVEFYINGQLAEALSYPRNGFICHSCCLPDTDFYPEKSRRRKAKILSLRR
jgi:hypothetical protein